MARQLQLALVHLFHQKKQKAEQAGRKRKLVSDEVEQLKKQKLCISNDIEAMLKSADDYADKAEKLHDLTYSVSKKNPPLRFSEIFSQTVGNF